MLKMQFFRSCAPLKKTFSSSASNSLKYFARSRVSSNSTCGCASAGSPSPSSSMTRKSSSCFSALASGSILLRSELASSSNACAFSRLFQKLSAAIRSPISPSRFCKVATSKKPPQMFQFFRGGGDVCFNGFEHRDRIQRSEVRSQNAFGHDGRGETRITELRGGWWQRRFVEMPVQCLGFTSLERCHRQGRYCRQIYVARLSKVRIG